MAAGGAARRCQVQALLDVEQRQTGAGIRCGVGVSVLASGSGARPVLVSDGGGARRGSPRCVFFFSFDKR